MAEREQRVTAVGRGVLDAISEARGISVPHMRASDLDLAQDAAEAIVNALDRLAPPADEAVEQAARALVWEYFQGCVSWEDTTDSATTGDEDTRRRFLRTARAALFSVGLIEPSPQGDE